ncbi:hypothetical protein OH77DRAFT_1023382 [Trametes cingulata]|nr:hypothetical protein OH77DRAFT_1023382 [Trametes cingulata]
MGPAVAVVGADAGRARAAAGTGCVARCKPSAWTRMGLYRQMSLTSTGAQIEIETLGQGGASFCCWAHTPRRPSSSSDCTRSLSTSRASSERTKILYSAIPILYIPPRKTAAGSATTECGISASPTLFRVSAPSHVALTSGILAGRFFQSVRTLARLAYTARLRDVLWARHRRYGSWAPLARTSTLTDQIARRLCWTYRSCGSTKLSRSRRTTRRTSQLRWLIAGARIREFAESSLVSV